MHRFFTALAIVLAVAAMGQRTSAQGLTFSLLERYVDALREQAGIPGLSALVLQNGDEAWARGFGRADLEAGIDAGPNTPYRIGGLSQMFGATLLLRTCIEENVGHVNDPVAAWVPGSTEPAPLGYLLAHVSTAGTFDYNLARFSLLTDVVEQCAGAPYREVITDRIFAPLVFTDSVPGTSLVPPAPADLEIFGQDTLIHFTNVLGRIAQPYRVDARGRAVRTELPPSPVNAATGVVTSVRDLAKFYRALDLPRPLLLQPATLQAAWRPAAPHLPAGYGWFVQTYNNELVAWQFGEVTDAYSSLVVHVPNRRVTFILLANSDALAVPFRGVSPTWDVTASIFARLFLRIFIP